ncbi:MAG TPA: hypothetical protein VE998_10355 [Terriglobales bacterium]|nr:hypothetical protein [Terriglobales bacterium]
MAFTMAARRHLVGARPAINLAIAVVVLVAAASGQTFFYYDANGHLQGKIGCTEQVCEVFAGGTALGSVTGDGTAFDAGGSRLGQTEEFGQNWRPGNFSVRPALPAEAHSSADPQGWAVPLEESLRSDAVGGDLDRAQLRALQAAATAYGWQHNFVSAADSELQRRASAPHEANAGVNAVAAVVVHDSDHNAYIMVRGVWVLAVGKASNSNQVTVWWPGAEQVETAVAPLSAVVAKLNAAGIVLDADDSNRVQRVRVPQNAAGPFDAGRPAELCISGDPKLRSIVAESLASVRSLRLNCSDGGNDLVLSVNPTGRWIAVMQLDDEPHFGLPRTAFEAIAVLHDRAGQELWWVRKEAWSGRSDRTRVAQQIAKAFRKFYASSPLMSRPAERAADNSGSGAGDN